MNACHTASKGDIVAIDGKTLRSSYDKSRKRGAIHMDSEFSAANNVVLGQVKTAEKSNEITADLNAVLRDPYGRWCGRSGVVRLRPRPIPIRLLKSHLCIIYAVWQL